MLKAWSRYFIALCLLSPFMFADMQAQPCIGDITMISPVEQSIDVSLQPTITIETNMNLVPGVLPAVSPDCGTGTGTCINSVMLLPVSAYQSALESDWYLYSKEVDCIVTTTRQIEISLKSGTSLNYGTQYALVFRGIQVEDLGVPCTDAIDQEFAFAFETIHEPSSVYATSLDNGAGINCSDDIEVVFHGLVQSMSTAQGDVIEMQQLISANNPTITPISITTTIGADNRTVTVDPVNNLQAGEWYELIINADYLTGDPSNQLTIPFTVRSVQQITYTINSLDPNTTLTQADVPFTIDTDYGVPIGESFKMWTPSQIGNLYLKEWTSNSPDFDLSTDNALVVTPTCDDIMDVQLTANYAILIEDTYRIEQVADGTVHVNNNTSHVVAGSFDEYTYPMDPSGDNPELILVAVPNPGYEFDKWSCPAEPDIDGFSNPKMILPGRSPYFHSAPRFLDITPVYKKKPAECPNQVVLNVFVYRDGYIDPQVRLEDIISIPEVPAWTTNEENLLSGDIVEPRPPIPTSISINATVDPAYTQCYHITTYLVTDGIQKGGVQFGGSPIGSQLGLTVNYPTINDCEYDVHIYVQQKLYDVQVSYKLDDNTGIPSQQYMRIDQTDYKGWVAGGIIPSYGSNGEWTGLTYQYQYACGTQAEHTPVLNNSSGQNLYNYGSWSCANPYRCTNIVSNNPDVIQFNVFQDEEILYEFGSNFRITQIGYMHTDDPTTRIWRNLNGNINRWENSERAIVAMDRQIGGLAQSNFPHSGPFHRSHPRLHFRFSDIVDESTLENGNLEVQEVNKRGGAGIRPDGASNRMYDYRINDNGDMIGTGDEVLLDLYTSGVYATHMDDLSIVITSQIKSQSGENLSNPFPYGLRTKTEMPGFHAWVDEFIIGDGLQDDHCWLGGEPDVIVLGITAKGEVNGNSVQNLTFGPDIREPETGCFQSVHMGEALGELLLFVPQMEEESRVEYGWVLIDNGPGLIQNEIDDCLADTRTEIQNLAAISSGPFYIGDLLLDNVKAEIQSRKLLCDDHVMDEMTIVPMSSDELWGGTDLYELDVIEKWSDGNYFGETFKIKYRQATGDVD